MITDDRDDALYMLRSLVKYREYGLQINFDKTEYMPLGLEEQLTYITEVITEVETLNTLNLLLDRWNNKLSN